MFQRINPVWLGVAAIALAGAGCSSNKECCSAPKSAAITPATPIIRAADMGPDIKEAVAVIHGTAGNEKVMGVVKFSDTGSGVKVTADIDGLAPDSEHGFHVHEFGDCTDPKGMSTGGHYNPDKHEHGKPGDANAHAGDMGNVKADDKGHAHAEVTLAGATITGKNALLGRGVILHANADKFTQPAGDAGGRIACGVIGVAQVKK